jgi:diguanylate cyclase (GGDEF)-like protein
MDPGLVRQWDAVAGDPGALASLMDALPIDVMLVELGEDGSLICRAANQTLAEVCGCAAPELRGQPIERFTSGGAREHLLAAIRDAIATGRPARALVVNPDAGDGRRVLHANAIPLAHNGMPRYVLAMFDDTGGRAASDLLASDLGVVLDAAPDIVMRYDMDLRLLYLNRAAERMLGRPRAELLRRSNVEAGLPAHVAERWDVALRSVAVTGEHEDLEFALETPEGHRWFHARLAPDYEGGARVTSVIATCRDFTEQRLVADALAHLAMHDSMTQLPNRRMLLERLQPATARARRTGRAVALLFVDLDDFKFVNDTLGHRAGDAVLRETAKRIAGASRAGDMVVRFGGDEFVVFCEDLEHVDDAHRIADRINAAMDAAFVIEGSAVTVRASVGVAVGHGDHNADELLHEADRLMYLAKEDRRRARVVRGG